MAARAQRSCGLWALLLLGGMSAGVLGTTGFIKSPLSQRRLTQDSVELYCEAIGNPIPEIQWWFEGNDPNETSAQLWDGAWQDRVKINATYNLHSTSTISISNLTTEDSGMYECRASNDPDRNHLSKSPKVKWIRSQANVFVIERPDIKTQVTAVAGKLVLTCNMSASTTAIEGHEWVRGEKVLHTDSGSSSVTSYTIEGNMEEHSGLYECVYKGNPVVKGQVNISVPPQVVPYKKSEHGNEGDTGVLTCRSPSFPPVSSWVWYKNGQEPIVNGSGRYIIKSSGNKTELRILKLNIEEDTGDYHCNATNSQGYGGAVVNLRVRSRLAALWPFLGIVAEVLVLVTIIFIYEKRRKPDEVLDDDDGGSAPLKSNATNHKDKNIRQRNAN
ncbi:basigin isoform X2 [Calypte anna]|uniref:basigin isoform X2 n=1 Tax=Calypte anna TaxID=9244 RepID=UPI0011C42E10|nr:basigin isoform X2 [Calypte anna]